MIRRINKKNDLKDIIKSCPSGVIDDIYKIEYYIQGYNTSIDATFTKVNNVLEVILPSGDLETLPNGILMRRAYYKVVDTSYPDGYYNLEFEDNMNIWLGEHEASPVPPAPGDYVTEGELVSTLSSYATQSWISSQQFATESWVSSQGYITSEGASGIATKSWVEEQGYITSSGVSGLATMSWVESQGYLTEVPSGYATESWVSAQGYLTSETIPSDIATQSWVESQGYLSEVPVGYATESWVSAQGYITSEGASGFATMSWVESQGYVKSNSTLLLDSTFSTVAGVINIGSFRDQTLVFGNNVEGNEIGTYVGYSAGYFNTVGGNTFYDPFATEGWVSNNFLSSTALFGYATQSWVESQGYLTSETIPSDIATQSWVESQNYLNSQSLTGYATESWVTSQLSDVVRFSDGVYGNEILVSYCAYIGTSSFGLVIDGQDDGYGLALFENDGTTPLVTTNDLQYYATVSWVSSNFLSSTALNGYATESWVQSQGYLTSVPSEYATESWVSSNFLSTTALSGYATQSWATSQFFEESKIWVGTQVQWDQLTLDEQVGYTIALITA